MTFRITKSSDRGFDENRPPCKNAVVGSQERHRLARIYDEHGSVILQDMTYQENIWTVEINTLEELLALQKEVGEKGFEFSLILLAPENEMPEIEIYDAYRE